MAEDLTFVINPEAQAASIDLFLKAVDDIRRLLRDVDYAVHRGSATRRWIISGLHASAPTVSVQPVLGDQESIDALVGGIRAVTIGTDQPPEYFTEQVLEDLRRMRRLFRGKDRARSIVVSVNDIQTATIEQDISEKANRILTAGYRNLGSLEGMLEIVSVHRTQTFTIWDRVSRSPVRCSVRSHSGLLEDAKALLGKRVIVRGSIRYFSNGVPRTITDIMEIIDATPDPNLPEATFGSVPDAEACRDPVDFLRKIRGFEE